MSNGHARLAPSSAGQWVLCPGSVVMQEKLPELPDAPDHGAEGDAAHWLAAGVLSMALGGAPADHLGQSAPNGVIITHEIVEAVDVYINAVLPHTTVPGVTLRTEQGLRMASVHATDAWGTPDAVIADGINSVLRIFDLKYGWGLVEAVGNYQLAMYAIGALEEIQRLGNPLPQLLELSIVQPRPYHPAGKVRTWRLTVPELAEYHAHLKDAGEEALGPNPRTIAGPDQCKHCSARFSCEALNKAAYDAVQWAGTAQPMNLNGPHIGLQLTGLKAAYEMLGARISGLEEQAAALIKKGLPVNGWALRPGQGKEVWDRPVEEVVAFGSMMGVDLSRPGAMTPKQARDELKRAKLPDSVIATVRSYSKVNGGGLKLVPAESNDKLAKEIFSHE